MTEKLTLTILGGGGFRVPLVYGALLGDDSPIGRVVLHDVDDGRLAAIRRVLAAQAATSPAAPAVEATTDLTAALTGADFVFSAIRVEGLAGRVVDERVALGEGVLGQETVGAGGVAYGLRTVPVATAIARRIALVAPAAWVINFTNPAGLVTEAMAAHLGERVIGICDSPSALARRVVRALGRRADDVRVEYAGLNHLGWLTGVRQGSENLLPRLLGDDDGLSSVEEGRLFGRSRLRDLAAVPNEYLRYYYDTAEMVRAELGAAETRGEFLLRQQQECYRELASEDPLGAWEKALRQRDATYLALEGLGERDDAEGGGYERIALALMTAIARAEPAELILNVRNAGTIAALDDDAVVEVPCRVDGSGAHPHPDATVPAHGIELVRRVKATERAILAAATQGSRTMAVRAMAAHPLVDSEPIARRLVDEYVSRLPSLSYLR
ncbi:6-phospho-beta-glucosidase [Paractinoplanes ferrugineus]|uniref:6-phospho-beta-glucosidase n=1 Tax=Paractinoplanes ferrugineus TaxID=113564 RepID=A0A919J7A5_9ACTN|nr:6-phospho-beta-glucosidase [Actinoplanes ferrugineus]GIE15835.1 6-phospho-beta-glucosidase [Actinoplanes ferrugineus]